MPDNETPAVQTMPPTRSVWRRRLQVAFVAVLAVVASCWVSDLVERREQLGRAWVAVENSLRDKHPITKLILQHIDLQPGHVVADVGAGGGYFTFKFAELVGPEGHVIATEIDDDMLDLLRQRASQKPSLPVTVIETEREPIGLQPGSVDRMLLSNLYLFMSCEPEFIDLFFDEARRVLRPGGRMVIMNEYLHLKGWQGSSGGAFPCDQSRVEELIKIAGNRFNLKFHSEVPKDPTAPHELPGYILVLERPPLASSALSAN